MNATKPLITADKLISEENRLGALPSMRSACGTVFKMAWPSIIEMVMLSVCSMMDTMMVGVVGTKAISAVGSSGAPRQLIVAFYSALNIAVVAIAARRIGEGNNRGANDTMRQSLIFSFILSLLIAVPGLIFAPFLIRLCNTPESILGDAVTYFRIWLVGVPVWAISAVINSTNRAAGRTKIVMVTNIVSNLVNVVFNYLLIGGKFGFPALGVKGAAIATFICFAVQSAIAVFSVLKKDRTPFLDLKSKFKFDRDIFYSIRSIAPSFFTEQIAFYIESLLRVRIVNSLGSDDAYASFMIVSTLYAFLVAIANGFSSAASALVGQELGRKRSDIAELDVKLSIGLAFAFSVVLVLVLGFFGDNIVALFVSDKTAGAQTLIQAGIMTKILACFSFISILLVILVGGLRGAGDVKYMMVISVMSLVIVRPLATYILCHTSLGVIGAWVAVVIEESFRTVLFYIRFKRGKWKTIRL